jgi:arginyl-tRNA synthetase
MLAGVVEDLLANGVAEAGEGGSVIIRGDGEAVTLIRKRDGAFTYTTTDLATIKYRAEEFSPDTILYVVDFRQAFHFQNLYAAARKWGYDNVEMTHVSFGSVLGKDGKPIKTRDGGGKELGDLIDDGIALGGRLFEVSQLKRQAHGHDVPEVSPDYKFDFDKMLATDGNTATYMQYAYARCRAIFRKGGIAFDAYHAEGAVVGLTLPAERALGLQLLRFEAAVNEAAAKYEPHHVAAYLWDLAKAFSTFFEACPVLAADTESVKASRLLLVQVTGRTIQAALNLLGIDTVEQM